MQSEKQQTFNQPGWLRISLIALAMLMLVAMYVFQQFNFLKFILGQPGSLHPYVYFIFNKTLRLVINDACCFVLILVLFNQRNYLKVAFWIFLFELLILLPIYFVLKLMLEGDSEISSPLLSQLHRLIINPTLMILLMVAFFYQRFRENKIVK